MPVPSIDVLTFAELDLETLYAILRLRVDVFVVEQRCPYPELDGRDTEPGTLHVLARDGCDVVAYLRLLTEPGECRRIGRVCVAPGHRGGGLADRLVASALDNCTGAVVVLDAQTQLRGWYARHGFNPNGPEFVEDGIPHLPMRRET